ncbi:hypothetical protein FRB90_002311 [Tulasnella sp. 427]|nr:hypothetical protein FRB90_002311 [Tulasnella sp. 427]
MSEDRDHHSSQYGQPSQHGRLSTSSSSSYIYPHNYQGLKHNLHTSPLPPYSAPFIPQHQTSFTGPTLSGPWLDPANPVFSGPTPFFNHWTPWPYNAPPTGAAYLGHGPAMVQSTIPIYQSRNRMSMYEESAPLNQAGNLQSSVSEPSMRNRVMLGIKRPRQTASNLQAQVPNGYIPRRTSCRLARLPTDLKLTLLEYMDAESILRLWEGDHGFRAVLSHPYGNRTWKYLQEASGVRPFTEKRPATRQEIQVMKYTLEESRAGRVMPLANGSGGAVIAKNAFRSTRVAGLECTKLSLEGLDVQDGYVQHKSYVALRQTVQFGVNAINEVVAQKPNSSKELQLQDIKGMIRGEQGWARDLSAIWDRQQQNPVEIKRMGAKRARRILSLILGMKYFKFCKTDIPNSDDPVWRVLVNKGVELTEAEWVEIKRPLLGVVKKKRDERFATILRSLNPPTPSYVARPNYISMVPEGAQSIKIGVFPVGVFLEICCKVDVATLSVPERTSRHASSVLRSKAADFVWRSVRLSMGLTVVYEAWPERQYLSYCMGKKCSCGREGLNIPEIVMIICGDCFEGRFKSSAVIKREIGSAIAKAFVGISTKAFRNMYWTTEKDGGTLVQVDYALALEDWLQSLPQATRESIPNDLFERHMQSQTDRFLAVAKECKAWQIARDPGYNGMFFRRAHALMLKISVEWSYGDAQAAMRLEECNEIVEKPYPLSDREWSVLKDLVARMLGKS